MMPWAGIQFVIVVFPDHTHLLVLLKLYWIERSTGKENKNENKKQLMLELFKYPHLRTSQWFVTF